MLDSSPPIARQSLPPVRCVALLSGGLDSKLAIRIMQQMGVQVEALNFKTPFTCCQDLSAQAADELGVRLTVVADEDDYLELVREPKFGYGRGANPCIDCRIYMFAKAARFMRDVGAQFVVSGEVIGQRPKSQKRRDLDLIACHSGLGDLLLRPLSARRLRPTLPERCGWVDRTQLYDFTGRSRKELISLAKNLGIRNIPTPSTGCTLTEVPFARKVFDLIQVDAAPRRWDYELLKSGRHYRLDEKSRVVVGRRAEDNQHLEWMFERADASPAALLGPDNFAGPTAMVVGRVDEWTLDFACGLLLRHTSVVPSEPFVWVRHANERHQRLAVLDPRAQEAANTAEGRCAQSSP